MRIQVDCCWICRSEKDCCGRVDCALHDGFGNILFDPLLQTLGSTTHVLTIAVAQELVRDVAIM